MTLLERFLKYVQIDSTSDHDSVSAPSTEIQWNIARVLEAEMNEMGFQDVYVADGCIVYGTIPGNVEGVPTYGLIAHMDTSPDLTGKDVKPRVIEGYDGKDIVLNPDVITSVEKFPVLKDKVGKTLIVTDGNTLLGADDKAGIAIILDFAQYLFENPSVKHGTIKVAFTPDEEVGRGTDNFDVEKFGCDFAYTVDGGEIDKIGYENFNAASAVLDIQGVGVHPGSSKHKMVNAALVGMKFNSLLNEFDRPEYTEGFEGFNHLTDIKGDVDHCHMEYIIRNHNAVKFAHQKEQFRLATQFINHQYGYDVIHLEIKDTYANMLEILKDHMNVVEYIEKAMVSLGIAPKSEAIRGGTDGARLTYDGLPCPNLGTGGYNCHGRYEFAVLEEMQLGVELLKKINEMVVSK
ncbi:MAG: peptidase T [Erysipelotrichales bacterium]|nr:peptidase T [Erysipelotrichales bacterium]